MDDNAYPRARASSEAMPPIHSFFGRHSSATMHFFHRSISPGAHTAFHNLSEAVRGHKADALPVIVNTKSAMRWYCRKAITVTDSYEVPQVQQYDPAPLLSFGVFRTISGTFLSNPLIWIEQGIVMGVFALVAFFFHIYPRMAMSTANPQIWKAFNEKDADIRNFCQLMSTMATFLLGFFTSLNVARWWRLRTEGIGAIWSATSQLCMFLSQNVTRDEDVLSSIRRYARASLMLVFMRQRGYIDQLGILKHRGILTADEVGQMQKWNTNLAESVWTWIAHILFMLYDQGLVKSEQQYVFLLDRVSKGRAGAATICAQLGTPIPMQYVHFIGLMVKVHNIGVAALMGTICAGNIFLNRRLMCVTITLRVFFLPMLYNSILFINEEIMNPFSGDLMDFPMQKFDQAIDSDGKSYVDAGKHLPSWMLQWRISEKSSAASSVVYGTMDLHAV